jgi:S1-C subfamily serine protease
MVASLATMEKPDFVEVKGDAGPRPSSGPRLGIKPGYSDDVVGVMVSGVSPGSPAEKAGLKADDVIVGVAGKPVKDLRTYMTAMSVQKPKTTIKVEVTRDGKKLTFDVNLE